MSFMLSCVQAVRAHSSCELFEDVADRARVLEAAAAPLPTYTSPVDAMCDAAERIARQDPAHLSPIERVRFLKFALAVNAWADSRINDAMIAIAGVTRRMHRVQITRGSHIERIEIEDGARSEIALAAHWTESYTQDRLAAARCLRLLLPATAASLASGAISQSHATAIAEGAERLAIGLDVDPTHPNTDVDSPEWQELSRAATQLDRRASAIACRSTRTHTKAAVTRIVDALDPEGMRRRREKAARDRGVWVQPEADGNSLLIARMRSVDANACLARILDLASASRERAEAMGASDGRTIGEVRAQVLTDVILRNGAGTQPTSRAARPRADIEVVITLDALLALQGSAAPTMATLRGAAGDEAITASEVRGLFAEDMDITLRRLVTDPMTGHLLDASPRRYVPTEPLRHFIVTRDTRCRWVGCNARAMHADLDHAVPFESGGATTRANLGAFCRRHHLLKTHEGFDLANSRADGSCTIVTPAGLRYEHEPQAVLPAALEPNGDDERPSPE